MLYLTAELRRLLGLNISVEAISWTDWLHRIRSDPPMMFIVSWSADYADPTNFLDDGLHYLRRIWNQPDFWDLVDEARYEINESKRLALCRQADKILIDQAVMVPLYHGRNHWLVKPWIRNWSLSPSAFPNMANVIIEPH